MAETNKGYAKTILFGEHFVVYGLESIAAGLGQVTTCEVKKISSGKGYELIDNRPATPGYKEEKKGEYMALISRILEYMKVPDNLEITLGGDLVPASGIGASAACAASLARAISALYKMNWNDEQINKAAFEGETAGSGTPSGVDNTVAVYGGFITFKKNLTGGANEINLIKIKKPIEIVLGNSGLTALTKEVVGDVKKLKEAKPVEMQKIFDAYVALEEDAKKTLAKNDLKKLGELMNKNHGLLQKITVSCKELDEIVAVARSAGAFGAKLTGTGRGGLVICLTPGKELQEKVAKAIEAKGYKATRTVIG